MAAVDDRVFVVTDSIFPFPGAVDFISSEPSGFHGTANKLIFDEKEERLLMACSDGIVRVYNAETGAQLPSFLGHLPSKNLRGSNSVVGGVCCSGIIDVVVLGADLAASLDSSTGLCLWLISTGECLYNRTVGQSLAIAKIDESNFVTGCVSGDLRFWRHHGGNYVATSRVISAHKPAPVFGGGDVVSFSIAVSGNRMATGISTEFRIGPTLWDLDSRTPLGKLVDDKHRFGVFAVQISSSRILSQGKGCISIWDVESQELVGHLDFHAVCVTAIVDEDHFLVVTSPGYSVNMRLMKISSGESVREIEMEDCQVFAVAGDGRIAAWFDDCGTTFPAPAPIEGLLRACVQSPICGSGKPAGKPSGSESASLQGGAVTAAAGADAGAGSRAPALKRTCSAAAGVANGSKRPRTAESSKDAGDDESDDLPDFADLKQCGRGVEYVGLLGTSGLAELIAAHLVAYRSEHLVYFKDARASAKSALLTAGFFDRAFILGEEPEVPADTTSEGTGWVQVLLKQLGEAKLVRVGTENRLQNLWKCWQG